MIKPIEGSWFEFRHHSTVEGRDWNPACAEFTAEQWEEKIKEAAELGIKYLVLMCVALYERAYYKTDIFPYASIKCQDPIEAVLSAADKYGIKFFMSNDFWGNWADANEMLTDPDVHRRRLKCMEELVERYGHHKSFYGWYWPNEAEIDGHFSDRVISYVNACSKEGRLLRPDAKILIAPYGTRKVSADDKYVRQLEQMDVDIIAYQDEVGIGRTQVGDSAGYYETLRKLHDQVPQRALWADVEVFVFEGEWYKSALLPASFDRVEKQLAAVSDFVDTILIYQFQGMMNKPHSKAFAGHPDSVKLYTDYVNWLKANHPDMIKF